MKNLYVLRHAKSSWGDASIADFDRPLNARGLRTAPFMGELAARHGLKPDLIVSSPARRAEQTASLFKEAAKFDCPLRFDERIYEASPQTLYAVISEIPANIDSLLLIGHNPGFEFIVAILTGHPQPMPTAALAVISLEIEKWSDIAPQTGTLDNIYRPKEEMRATEDE